MLSLKKVDNSFVSNLNSTLKLQDIYMNKFNLAKYSLLSIMLSVVGGLFWGLTYFYVLSDGGKCYNEYNRLHFYLSYNKNELNEYYNYLDNEVVGKLYAVSLNTPAEEIFNYEKYHQVLSFTYSTSIYLTFILIGLFLLIRISHLLFYRKKT